MTDHCTAGAARARIAFISSNRSWGGSEELWAATAAWLAGQGHDIRVFKHGIPESHPQVRHLKSARARIVDLRATGALARRVSLIAALESSKPAMAAAMLRLWLNLLVGRRPDLVVISQGGNYDGWPIASLCRRLKLRYVCICHKASDLHWPPDRWRTSMRQTFASARWSFFVSKHTLRLTQEQIGEFIPRSSIVRNPFGVPWDAAQPWPSSGDEVRLGCIGRLNAMEKGQDLLLRVLASEKWRSRPLSVTILGDGLHRKGLEAMAAYLGLASVRFAGTSSDIAGFWRDHHALVLPSRAEGLPLVLVEALLSGRIAIATDAGGNAELLHEGVNGFIASAPTEESLDRALERAWDRRGEWQAMGSAAAADLRRMIPADPGRAFAERLLQLIGEGQAECRTPECAGAASL